MRWMVGERKERPCSVWARRPLVSCQGRPATSDKIKKCSAPDGLSAKPPSEMFQPGNYLNFQRPDVSQVPHPDKKQSIVHISKRHTYFNTGHEELATFVELLPGLKHRTRIRISLTPRT
ncbi:hypothetical protein RvY_01397 [Ramazzottius varieornatus]|uniref:Uncharacterized protein n=1 Tax=Ramazzottius varieornatus TaxID=947166 RepID=A0A1D1UJQ7_RAMVA|nr:hypothetical protein RvY_01397 [Ramazzottius varieornatus]